MVPLLAKEYPTRHKVQPILMSKWALHIEHDVPLYTAQLGRETAVHTPLLMKYPLIQHDVPLCIAHGMYVVPERS